MDLGAHSETITRYRRELDASDNVEIWRPRKTKAENLTAIKDKKSGDEMNVSLFATLSCYYLKNSQSLTAWLKIK